jgi:hypothetical protein
LCDLHTFLYIFKFTKLRVKKFIVLKHASVISFHPNIVKNFCEKNNISSRDRTWDDLPWDLHAPVVEVAKTLAPGEMAGFDLSLRYYFFATKNPLYTV